MLLYGECAGPISHEFIVGNCILAGDMAFIHLAHGSAAKHRVRIIIRLLCPCFVLFLK
jgi:hypothetical protein